MANSTPTPSISPEPLEARRLLSVALSHPTSVVSPRAPSAPSPSATSAPARATASSPAASNAEDAEDGTSSSTESDEATESTPVAPQQPAQQADGESTDSATASDGEAASPAPSPSNAEATPPAPVSTATEPPPPSPARINAPDRPDDFNTPILLASQAAPSGNSAPFATATELAASELAHTLFSTRPVLALGEMERAGIEAIPVILRTLIGNSGPATLGLPGTSPSAGAPATPDLADMADLAARTMTNLGRPDALAAFADAIATFAHESAAPGTLAAVTTALADAPANHARAWAVSAAVLTADAVLIGQRYGARRRDRRRQADAQRAPHPFAVGKS